MAPYGQAVFIGRSTSNKMVLSDMLSLTSMNKLTPLYITYKDDA